MKHLIQLMNGWVKMSWILGTVCDRDSSDQILKSVSDLEEDDNFKSEDQLPWECNICNSNEKLLSICTFDSLRIWQCCLTNLTCTGFLSHIDWKSTTTVCRDYDYCPPVCQTDILLLIGNVFPTPIHGTTTSQYVFRNFIIYEKEPCVDWCFHLSFHFFYQLFGNKRYGHVRENFHVSKFFVCSYYAKFTLHTFTLRKLLLCTLPLHTLPLRMLQFVRYCSYVTPKFPFRPITWTLVISN